MHEGLGSSGALTQTIIAVKSVSKSRSVTLPRLQCQLVHHRLNSPCQILSQQMLRATETVQNNVAVHFFFFFFSLPFFSSFLLSFVTAAVAVVCVHACVRNFRMLCICARVLLNCIGQIIIPSGNSFPMGSAHFMFPKKY